MQITKQAPFVDRSGTTGTASKKIADKHNARLYLFIQNISGTDKWVRFGSDAADAPGNIKLTPNGYWESPPTFCPTSDVYIFCTANENYTCLEGF